MRRLPLPPAGRVAAVLHLSDLHIRAGERQKCRFDEYANVIHSLHEAVRALPAVQEGTAVAVVTGDVFHDKNTISPGGVLLFRRLVEVMRSERVPMYVMRGNHDFRQDLANPEEPDMIQALLQGVDPEHVAYMDRTGHYVAGTVGFGVLAIQDVLQLGSTSGHVDVLPAFPDVDAFPADVKTRIALFHGIVSGSRMPNNHVATDVSAIDEASMRSYDYALLGDVHVQQIHGALDAAASNEASFPKVLGDAHAHRLRLSRLRRGAWGYAGSLVQQNFGETVLGHGFLLWQVDANPCVAAYHVSNKCGYLTLSKNDNGLWSAAVVRGDHPVPIADLQETHWFPRNVRVRIDGTLEDRAELRDLSELLSAHGFHVRQGVQELVSVAPVETQEAAHRAVYDLSTSVYTPDTWINYVSDKVPALASEDAKWHEWFRRPGALLPVNLATLPATELPSGALAKLEERNKKLAKTVQEYDKLLDRQLGRCRAPLAILDMEWAWVLCYGDGCRFDFQKAKGHVFALSGSNGAGKTAFLEILFYGLFGTAFPSRATNHAIALVNMRKPFNQRPYIKLNFVLGGETYRLIRKLDAQVSAQKLNNKDVSLSRRVEGAVYVPEACGKTKVDQWMREHVGDPDAFLQACMLTQHNDNDFFELAPRDQMALLDKLLAMDGAALLTAAFKESRKVHQLCLDALQAPMDLHEQGLRALERDAVDVGALEARLEAQRALVRSAEDNVRESQDAWMAVGKTARTRHRDADVEALLPALEGRRPPEPRCSAEELRVRRAVLAQRQSAWPREWVDGGRCDDNMPDDSSDEEDIAATRDALLLAKPAQPRSASPPAPPDGARLSALRAELDGLLPQSGPSSGPPPAAPRKTLEEWRAFEARRCAVLAAEPPGASGERLRALADKLEAIRAAKAEHADALRTLHENYNMYNTLKVDNKAVPFNPQCAACRQQPWKQQMMALKDRVSNTDKPKVHECTAHLDGVLEGRAEAEWAEEHDALKQWLRDASDIEAVTQFWEEERRRHQERAEWEAAAASAHRRAELQAEADAAAFAEEEVERHKAYAAWKRAFDEVEARIAGRKRREFAREARMWADESTFLARETEALAAFSSWEEDLQEVRSRVAEKRYQAAVCELSAMKSALAADEAQLQRESDRALQRDALRRRWAALDAARSEVDARHKMLTVLTEPLEGFKAWVYETHLMPMFVRHTNSVIGTLAVDRPVALQVAWREARGGERVPVWHLVDGGISPPLEKASGFQRFLTSFAARLALSRLGACGVSPCSQLFLDEGFTSCDATNLENVPVFLQGLIARGSYASVLLVTHIDALSRCATLRVGIQQHHEHGRRVQFPQQA